MHSYSRCSRSSGIGISDMILSITFSTRNINSITITIITRIVIISTSSTLITSISISITSISSTSSN